MVILISLVALGAGKFPCCKPDEGNRISFGSASSHVLTENYSVIASRVFALDAIISLYGHVGTSQQEIITTTRYQRKYEKSECCAAIRGAGFLIAPSCGQIEIRSSPIGVPGGSTAPFDLCLTF